MPLDPLASVDDVAAILALESSGVDEAQADAELAAASAYFRGEALCDFIEEEATLILRVDGNRVDLPKRPVTSVTSVRQLEDDGTTGSALTGWKFDGIHTIRLVDQSYVINSNWGPDCTLETVQVAWDHGFADVPEDVRWVVAHMVARALSSPAPGAGLDGESIGAYSWTAGDNAAAMSMTDDERAVAKRYRPPSPNAVSVST